MYELYIRVAAKWLFLVLLTAPKIFVIGWSRTETFATISQDRRLGVLIGRDTHTRFEYSVKYKFSLSFSFVFVFQFAFELGEDLRGCYASVAERSER